MSSNILHVIAGKILNLMCITTEQDVLGPPDRTEWTINGKVIDFSLHRGGINIQSVKRRLSSTSKLTILNFQHEDAGSYGCRNIWHFPENDDLTRVMLK